VDTPRRRQTNRLPGSTVVKSGGENRGDEGGRCRLLLMALNRKEMSVSTNLSHYFEQKRREKGLKPGQLARLAGCVNVQKNGSRIRSFELSGSIGQELFEKIAAALEIDAATYEQLVEQDRKEFYQAWLEWVNEPIQPYLVIRLMAAIYNSRTVTPEITTMEEAEGWAGAVAREIKKRTCLVWSRRISCWFSEDGTLSERTEAVPGEPNVPWIKIGGKGPAFVFGDDLGTVSLLDWPKKPGSGGGI
jgi:hypothetical protein